MDYAAFIFIAEGADPALHRTVIKTPEVNLTVVGVSDYAQAALEAKELVDSGCTAIELCGGFDRFGAQIVLGAVGGRADVGRVCFDVPLKEPSEA